MHTRDKVVLAVAITLTMGILVGTGYRWFRPPKSPSPSWQQGMVVRSTPTGLWRLQWGYQDGRVRFLAFVRSGDSEPRPLISVNGPMPRGQVLLSRPNQPQEEMPADFNVFECVDGHFEQQHVALTVEQAKAYCGSERDAYTIKSLRDFLNAP